jgi:microcystin-dependent protein
MASPFLGQIQPFGFGFAPKGWALCNGQIFPISQNTALFSLLGTMYGGDGKTNFALPNLQSRVPMHLGNTIVQGQTGGEESITLTVSQLPAHNHGFSGTSGAANSKSPNTGSAFAQSNRSGTSPGDNYYAPDNSPGTGPLNPTTVGNFGGGLPHTNLQPYLTINWCIALQGVFPARN